MRDLIRCPPSCGVTLCGSGFETLRNAPRGHIRVNSSEVVSLWQVSTYCRSLRALLGPQTCTVKPESCEALGGRAYKSIL
jgi:hypothetical protein